MPKERLLGLLAEIQEEEMTKAQKVNEHDLDKYVNRYLDFSEGAVA